MSPPRDAAGIKSSVQALMREGLNHVRLRCALAGLEASMAAGHLRQVAVAAVVLVAGGGIAYLAGLAALVAWAADQWTGGRLAGPLAVAAAVHAVAAVAAGWWLVARGRRHPLFPATRAELQEDRKWLQNENL